MVGVGAMNKNIVERLAMTNPDLETWGVSSLLVYRYWVQKMLKSAEPNEQIAGAAAGQIVCRE